MESLYTLADMAVFLPAQYENLQKEIHRGNVFISAWLKIVSDKSESHKF